MAVPKSRRTKSSRNRRRMHIFLKAKQLATCSNCGGVKLPHRVCGNCGFYNGRQVLDIKEKKKKIAKSESEGGGFKSPI